MSTPIPVHVKDCPHHEEGHSVLLLPTISLDGGIAAEQDLYSAAGDDKLLTRLWLTTFLRYGAVGWDLCLDGEPIPFDVDVLLADYALARPVAEKAAELYAAAVTAPFLPKPATRSPTGRTRATTSRRSRPTPLPSA